MFIAWLLILIIYGVTVGFNTIPTLAWLLLIVFAYQDNWDIHLRK